MTRALACLAAAVVATASAPAAAQQYLLGAAPSVSSGAQGGTVHGTFRARTRLRLGMDARVDEFPEDILEVGLLGELEPRAGFGADVRYARAAGKSFLFDAGALGIVVPESLYGVCASFAFRLPISRKVEVRLGPEADFFFLGSDLPDKTVIWELRLQGGVHVDL